MWWFCKNLEIDLPNYTTLKHTQLKECSEIRLQGHIHLDFIHNNQQLEITWMFLNRRMDKKYVIHLYHEVLLLSH